MDEKILKEIYESIRNGESVAMTTITTSNGSSPRKNGSMMAVWKDGRTIGSVGGGKVEHEVILKAMECIEKNEDSNFEYNLSGQGTLGMQCGGDIKGFIKVLNPRKRILIAGGGHIGEKLYQFAKLIDFYTVILDDREEFANKKKFPDADEIIVGDIGASLSKYEITENDYVVIVSRGHAQDKDALKAVISRGAAYVGMIGSAVKVIYVIEKLMEEGIGRKELEKIYAPIGLNISSDLPEEIAFGIMSEILLVKNKGSLTHRRDTKKVWG